MNGYALTTLDQALDRLRGSGWPPAAAAHLRANAPAVQAALRDAVLAAIPAFTESRDPATLRELAVHAPRHLEEIVRLLDGGAVGDFDFVRQHARLRADHHFPLEAVLHAYRCGHKVFGGCLREAALGWATSADAARDAAARLADFTLEYTDAISTIASAAYVEQVRLQAAVAGDQRAQLLGLLLDGYDESDARVAALLREAGYLAGRQAFVVVVAQSIDATEMQHPARARRIADCLDQLVPAALARRLIDVRDAQVVAVFAAVQRASGWTAPRAPLAERIARELALAGNAVRIGVSGDVASTSRVPAAHHQARLAMRLAGLERRVVCFDDVPLRALMIHLSGADLQRLLPPWAAEFLRADDGQGGTLVATLRAYADADMNLLKAAARLEVHPNTIYARFNRIHELTGLNPRGYHALSDLITVADATVAGAAASPR